MTVREQIDRMIASRKDRGEALKQRKAEMQEVKSLLKKSNSSLVAQVKGITDEKLRAQYAVAVGRIDTRGVQKQLDQFLRNLDDGIRRFGRDYISIAYDATSCTGATSIIWNAPEVPKGSVRATITFRQPAELLDMVIPLHSGAGPGLSGQRDAAIR